MWWEERTCTSSLTLPLFICISSSPVPCLCQVRRDVEVQWERVRTRIRRLHRRKPRLSAIRGPNRRKRKNNFRFERRWKRRKRRTRQSAPSWRRMTISRRRRWLQRRWPEGDYRRERSCRMRRIWELRRSKRNRRKRWTERIRRGNSWRESSECWNQSWSKKSRAPQTECSPKTRRSQETE